jgi:deoxyribose-phosphate aldolase
VKNIAQYIDQTILKPQTTKAEILTFLREVKEYGFCSAVVNPCWVEMARAELPLSIKVCSVVGFPLGASSLRAKVFATEDLCKKGCDEIDMVMNIGKFLSTEYEYVGQEIEEVVSAASGRIVKVIIETCLLSDTEKKKACEIIIEKRAHFVKTSTGFSTKGATIKDVRLLRQSVGPTFGVKASGGIRDYGFANELIVAGANRLGTSAGVAIVVKSRNSLKT